MAKFIKVHEAPTNNTVIVNVDSIVYVEYDNEKKKAFMRISDGITCHVFESIDKIFEKIQA